MQADTVMMTQAVDEEDPVLGFTPGWVNALARHVGRLSVYCLRAGKGELRENVSLHVLGEGKCRRLWRLRKGLKADLREMNVRAIFAHMCPRYAVAARRMVGRKVPIVLWYAHSAKSIWLRLAHRICKLILTPTVESCPLRSPKVRVVGHGIDTERFRPEFRKRDGRVVVLSAGRISPVKRHDFLLQAVAGAAEILSPEGLLVRILGSPSLPEDERYLDELKHAVHEKGLRQVVEFRPAVPYTAMRDQYAACDVFINTAIGHSVDKAPLEAMACGKILLTSNQNFRAVLKQHANALIADEKKPDNLAKRIVEVARMKPSERERVGRALREIVVGGHGLDRLMKKVGEIIAVL
jgi:glycosyltransferase involved in cell wall biosynthesis